jgi:hypothetical protein
MGRIFGLDWSRSVGPLWDPPRFCFVLHAQCVAVRAVRTATHGPTLPLVNGVQWQLHAETPMHTSLSVFQMLLILLQVQSKQDF